ncbi:hypothetical protein [Actinoplanes couchii]|uniref:Bacterial sugar transferase domain-containing protein n=1 Tax=Actinoplanes couchii TaxID=403638 RepID=A0ABQ3XPW1_9ACTN|nr:hypothetical protein [Actinoplanes couchii]MDR6323808.1 hypothetical protein [Actinoplanes couchii]GID60557.1 hypothetical protein Aco03nite_089610 [Actinoplanes couchii]
MAIAHIAVLSAALSVLLIFPCAATILLSGKPSDMRRLFTRAGRRELRAQALRSRAPRSRAESPFPRRVPARRRRPGSLRRLERGMRSWDQGRLTTLRLPAIEEIAFDLRRLDRQRRNLALHSEVLHAATMRSYDARLSLACRCLGITEFLDPLTGLDRDAERCRVEYELAAAGLIFRQNP